MIWLLILICAVTFIALLTSLWRPDAEAADEEEAPADYFPPPKCVDPDCPCSRLGRQIASPDNDRSGLEIEHSRCVQEADDATG